jgi:hypothetical protein
MEKENIYSLRNGEAVNGRQAFSTMCSTSYKTFVKIHWKVTFGIYWAIRCEQRFIFIRKENMFSKEWQRCRSREWNFTNIFYDVQWIALNKRLDENLKATYETPIANT